MTFKIIEDDNLSEKQLDKQARDFMQFPPKKFQNGQKNKTSHFGRDQPCGQSVREDNHGF